MREDPVINDADIAPIYAILFGRAPEFNPSVYKNSNQLLRDFIKSSFNSSEFMNVTRNIADRNSMPHSHATPALSAREVRTWLVARFGCENEPQTDAPVSWWTNLDAFIDGANGIGVSFPASDHHARVRGLIRSRSLEAQAGTTFQDLVRSRLVKSRLLGNATYFAANEDVRQSGMDALDHYFEFGRLEGRLLFNEKYGSGLVGSVDRDYHQKSRNFLDGFSSTTSNDETCGASMGDVLVYVHSQGNYYMKPIARAIARALNATGQHASVVDEHHSGFATDRLNIVVAPHEFFTLDVPIKFKSSAFYDSCIAFNTEQIPSKYFSRALRDILQCRGVIDINFQSFQIFEEFMPACYFLPPFGVEAMVKARARGDLTHPLYEAYNPQQIQACGPTTDLSGRPIDVTFTGFSNPYRDGLFVRETAYLASKTCFLAYKRPEPGPVVSGMWGEALFDTNTLISCATKIVLAAHRYPTGYFEWERMVVQGLASGACVLATPGMQAPFFEPGVHYIEAPLRHFGAYLRYLLDSKEGRHRAQVVASAGQTRLQALLTEARAGDHLRRFLHRMGTL